MGFGKTEYANQLIIQRCLDSNYKDCPPPSDGGIRYQQRWGLLSLPKGATFESAENIKAPQKNTMDEVEFIDASTA